VRSLLAVVAIALACACAPSSHRGEVPQSRVSLLAFRWSFTDELGQHMTLARWRGTPIVLAPIYTSCSRVCPLTVAKLRKVQDAATREGRNPQFLLVTFDPVGDTPERLRDFKEAEKLPSSWHLLRGSEQTTRELLDVLGIHFIEMGSHIVHETRIAVLDQEGTVTRTFRDVDFDDDAAAL
jgi:protein SCO1/2